MRRMQNLAWRIDEASLRLLIWMPGRFCKIRQGQRMYLVCSDSEGSGALCRKGWTHGQRSPGLHRQAMNGV